jgi:hypothetical protein
VSHRLSSRSCVWPPAAAEAGTPFRLEAREVAGSITPVPGVGSEAYWAGNQLSVMAGGIYLIVGGDISMETAKALAQAVIGRLG